MKPDGVTTAALEPMETLEANPANEEIPAPGQEPNQAASPGDGEAVPQSQGDAEASKETPAKPNKKPSSGDAKSKTPNKTTKAKPGTTAAKGTTASKTTPSRLSNGVSKPQTNGVPKKTTPAPERRSTPLTAAPKKPTGTTPTPRSAPKTGEKKTPTATPLTNGAKTATSTAKKTPTATNGVKTSSTSAAAKKPPGSSKGRHASCSIPSQHFVLLFHFCRTPSGTSAARPPSSSTTKSSAIGPKPTTPKPSSASSKPTTSKSATPSAGKAPAAQTSKTPVKKDVGKSATSPYVRASPAPKAAKQEVPKSTAKPGTASKKPTTTKAVDSKTPTRPKTESKATSSKDAPKTSKTAAPKTTSPKKTVGSSTPTPVKRGPKATEADKDGAVAVAAAAAAAAAAATVIVKQEEQPPPAVENIEHPEPTPVPPQLKAPSTEPLREPTPEPVREPTPEPVREPTPEPVREPTPEPVREPTPEPLREPTPEPLREPTPEPLREPTQNHLESLPQSHLESLPQNQSGNLPQSHLESLPQNQSGNLPQNHLESLPQNQSESLPQNHLEKPTPRTQNQSENNRHLCYFLGHHSPVPPCSPTGPVSPSREIPNASLLVFQSDQSEHITKDNSNQEQDKEEESNEKENLFMVSAATSNMMEEPQTLSASTHVDVVASGGLASPYEKEDAVEKAEEEINEDDDDEEDDEDEDQRRFGHQHSSMITDLSSSQPSEDIQRSPAFGGSLGWHGDDLLSGMDSEDMSSCTSSRQQGVSDLSSTQHTAILEGTQSSDEEDDDDDVRVDDMDLSSERVEEHHKFFSNQEHEEEDEDVEMHSEGKTESGGNVEEDFNDDERLDSLNQCSLPVSNPPTSAWGQTNPFGDTFPQPASVLPMSSPSQMFDHGAADSETLTQSPAQTCFDSSVPTFAPQSDEDPIYHISAPKDTDLMSAPADVPVQRGGSESSTPEDLREYDSSSGVESRSDKQHTPVPAHGQLDVEQDLGIHMEKVDGEEEEAETLPADEVMGTGPPTAPVSAPSSASTSGDEASDTEGEMQINDPDAPMTMGESAGFDSPTPTSNLPTFDEDEEVMQAVSVEAEEDGGGATPQSANSVASYGFDCTNSNSNAHSMAESCGKSPGIFSLENEEQLPAEAKDPSLIKELTLVSASTAAEDLLDRPVNLMPLGHSGDHSGLDEHHYMMGSKMEVDLLQDVDPQEPVHLLDNQDSGDSDENQPPYYSTICDKTDSFLEGNDDEDMLQSQENIQNQNHVPIANGHYLALVPGNRRPIDPAMAAHFSPLIESCRDIPLVGDQLRRPEQHQEKVREVQERREQEQQKQQWLEEEQQRLEQHRHLQEQREELLQLQQEQQQRQSRHRLQWQLELELQYRMHQKHLQQQQQLRKSPTGLMLSPSSGLCTIYEAMETSDEEEDMDTQKEVLNEHNQEQYGSINRCTAPMLEWNMKVDMVQQLINQTLMLCGDGRCPLLHLPVGTGGSLSPLESSMWPHLLSQLSAPATVTAVSSYSPDSRCTSPPGDWTVVEVETHH
uniref:BTB/POZ domain-containing protein n=1 Tax=Neogobius melanostomus TaxID=47308 RepID=A0A8C6U425_9GOBI